MSSLASTNAAMIKITRPGIGADSMSKHETGTGVGTAAASEIVWTGSTGVEVLKDATVRSMGSNEKMNTAKIRRIKTPFIPISNRDLIELVIDGQTEEIKVNSVEPHMDSATGDRWQVIEFERA